MRSNPGVVSPIALLLVISCGPSPLGGVGERASDWVAEPTVVTTTTVPTTVPLIVSSAGLIWFNDELSSTEPGSASEVRASVFARREGDRFIQASRFEVAAVLPELEFPAVVPMGADYVTSQLVFAGSGALANDPVAAFGLWTSEPYTRSRSVAQIAVLEVMVDPDAAQEVAEGTNVSCDRFSERTTESCSVESTPEPRWVLSSATGSTVIWYRGTLRYELFGRPSVSEEALLLMHEAMEPLPQLLP